MPNPIKDLGLYGWAEMGDELAREIGRHNDDVASYADVVEQLAAERAALAAEAATLTFEELQARGLEIYRSEFNHARTRVDLARQRHVLLKKVLAEYQAQMPITKQRTADVEADVIARLEGAGLGVESQPAYPDNLARARKQLVAKARESPEYCAALKTQQAAAGRFNSLTQGALNFHGGNHEGCPAECVIREAETALEELALRAAGL